METSSWDATETVTIRIKSNGRVGILRTREHLTCYVMLQQNREESVNTIKLKQVSCLPLVQERTILEFMYHFQFSSFFEVFEVAFGQNIS